VQIFENLSKKNPGVASSRNLANSFIARAITLDYTGDDPGMREANRRALEILEELHEQYPKDTVITEQLSSAWSTYGNTLLGVERDEAALDEQLAAHTRSLALNEEAFGKAPKDVDQIRSLFVDHLNLAQVLMHKGRYADAYEHCQLGREMTRQLSADTKNAQTNIDLVMQENHCARALRALGRFDEADRIARSNYSMLERMERENDNLYVTFHFGVALELLGSVSEHRGQWERAREQYETSLQRFKVVTDAVTLDYNDTVMIDNARDGLARVEARLARR
jgi:tetratricopeptide (TPR) repeat protein